MAILDAVQETMMSLSITFDLQDNRRDPAPLAPLTERIAGIRDGATPLVA